MSASGVDPIVTWEQFAAMHADLFDWKNSILLHYYQKETLQSELARRIFVMPDRFERPLPLTYKMTETESLLR